MQLPNYVTMSFLKVSLRAAFFVAGVCSAPVTVLQQGIGGSLLYTLINSTSPFYVPSPIKSAPVGTYQVPHIGADTHVPFTVLVTNASIITSDVLAKTLASYADDEVYSTGFVDGQSTEFTP
jgi:hypothetical protein